MSHFSRRSMAPMGAIVTLLLPWLVMTACAPNQDSDGDSEEEGGWISLFNGRDLTGWTLKITGQELGVDPWETVYVEDGLLTVGYENYDGWQDRFGHLFYQEPFSHFQLRVEYRFIGDQVPDAPGWAFKNNGIMFHAQAPETMLLDQRFPLSIEAQLLGGDGSGERPTGNVCTPGTDILIDGQMPEGHCISASAPTVHGEEWVTFEMVVRGGESVVHVIDGDTVMAYSGLVVGGATVEEFGEPARAEGQPLSGGYIALQSESHPIQF
ncbi:MAG: DUF1080 domain-containing protein, partial [Gemmatimonadetes bacterium]|nr:DUF1080 domain-containing protein [Gemmatimonadota bacterium]